jgi:hypothetical protein
MKVYVKVNGKVIGKGKDTKSCLKHIAKLFKEGRTDITLSGGRIGKWMK